MLASKMSVIKPLIESNGGQHLSAYLKNDQNIFQIRKQLRETIDIAYVYLVPVMSPDALVRFLAPLYNAIDYAKLLKSFEGNICNKRSSKKINYRGWDQYIWKNR